MLYALSIVFCNKVPLAKRPFQRNKSSLKQVRHQVTVRSRRVKGATLAGAGQLPWPAGGIPFYSTGPFSRRA